jgi:hypothetical protein
MNDIDLNINNYDFNDLLKMFKIKSYDDKKKCDNLLETKYELVKTKFPKEIQNFYLKSKTILKTIIGLFDANKLSKDDNNGINNYIERIKSVKQFENFNETDLMYKIHIINNYNDDVSELLNEPNYDVNRLNPSLNNKNNTNIVLNTAINEVSPGHLNSVKRITQLLNLNLNSCFRNNYYQSNPCDFQYIIPSEIKNVLSMRLVSIEIPNSWYLFSSIKKNNSFIIEINLDGEKTNYDIIIPDGNYDSDTLQHYLNTTYFYESGLETPLKNIRFNINNYNLKTSFEIVENEETETNNFNFSLKFIQNINQNAMNTLGWTLGFRLGSYLNIHEKICSEGLFDAGGDRYIYLCINDYQYNSNTSNTVCFDKSVLNEDVLAKIPMINGKFSLIVNDNNNSLAKIRRYNGPINLSRLQIKIIDKFGTVIDLNNMDYSLTLELELLYESFNFKNVTA